jgi:hypothetical protein
VEKIFRTGTVLEVHTILFPGKKSFCGFPDVEAFLGPK